MKVKTFKRMSKRFISSLLSVLMVLSLFTVCMVGSTITAGAHNINSSTKIIVDISNTGWSQVYLYIGAGDHTSVYSMTTSEGAGKYSCTLSSYGNYDGFFFADANYNIASTKSITDAYNSISATSRSLNLNGNGNSITNADLQSQYNGETIIIKTINTKMTADISKTGWSQVYLYVGNSSSVTKYTMTQVTTTVDDKTVVTYTAKVTTTGYSGYFFSSEEISDVGSTSLYTLYETINNQKKSVDGNGKLNPFNSTSIPEDTVVVTVSDIVSTSTYYLDATLFNYRTDNQSTNTDSNRKPSSTVEAEMYDVDTHNGMASSVKDGKMYSNYNTAVSTWFKDTATATPLYEGNFHDLTINKTFPESLHNWVKVANAANRKGSNDGDNIKSAAQGLVDAKLSDIEDPRNGTITQNNIEIPQFSDSFTTNNPTLQSKYSDLKFEVTANKKTTDNTWYSYDSSTDGNRSLNLNTRIVENIGNYVHGYTNEKLTAGSNGYYPFNPSQPTIGNDLINSNGTRFDVSFVMPADNTGAVNGEQLQFKFSGDDDLWVFIDGYLVLDLGGSHSEASGSINLATKKTTIKTGFYNATYSSVSDRTSASIDYTSAETTTDFTDEVKTALADTTKEHTMSIFYMERGQFESNLSFEFFLPQTDSLKIEQKIDTANVNPGLLDETLNTANNDVFEVVLETNSASANNSNHTALLPISKAFERVNNDNTTTTLQAAKPENSIETPTGVAFKNSGEGMVTAGGTTFVWSDTNADSGSTNSSIGTGIVDKDDGGINLLYNQSAAFNDQFKTGSKMHLSASDNLQSFDIPDTGATTNPPGTSPNNRTVSKYYAQTYVIKDNINQDINQDDDETFYFQYNNGVKESVKLTAIYTNKIKTGTVKFTKKLDSSETDDTTEFTFEVLFSNVFGGSDTTFKNYDVEYTVLDKDGNEIVADSGTGSEIKLNVGETAVITGVPIGTKYRITETGDTNNDKDYTVSDITTNANTTSGSVEEKEVSSSTGGTAISNNVLVGVVNNPTSADDDSISHFDFNNTDSGTKVVYRFYDRSVTTGLPTGMETHYTYFTGELNGKFVVNGNTSEETIEKYKQAIIDNAPNIKNVLKAYNLTPENIEFNHTITSGEIGGNAEGTGNLTAGETVVLATYTPIDRKYVVQFEYYDMEKGQTTTSVTRSFNELVCANNEIKSVKSYTTKDDGVQHTFKYWAKKVNDGTGGTVYTPAFTNYGFNYRVTDNAVFVAVYSNTDLYNEITNNVGTLESPNVYGADTDDYLPTGDGTGYDASAAERVYDSYTLDVTSSNVTTTQNYTRINVVFGSVGSLDMDRNITHVGYVLIKNDRTDSSTMTYATDDLFSSESLLSQLEANGNEGATGNLTISTDNKTAVNGKTSFPAMVGFYKVDNNIEYAGTGLEGDYVKDAINLTNKNRLNLVFDKKNTEAAKKSYYTCYTVMVREDYEYDASGNKISDVKKKYYYVSDTPAYFNLGEAEPNISQSTCLTNYNVITKVVDQNGNYSPNAGTITTSAESSANVIKDGDRITITVNPTSYPANGGIMLSTLSSVTIGNVEVSADKFTKTKAGTYTYTFNFDNDVYLSIRDTNNVDIIAKFNLKQDNDNVIVSNTNVNCTNGSVQVSADGTTYSATAIVAKGTDYYVKAIPADGYELEKWSDGNTDEIIILQVADDGSYLIPDPTFKQYVTFTVSADSTMGTVSVTGTDVADLGNNQYKALRNTPVTIKADPTSEYNFTSWTATGGTIADPTTAEITITPSNGATYTANFDTKYVTFTVSTANSTMGTVSVTGTGVMDLGNDQYKVEKDTTVTITATPTSEYNFTSWTATGGTITDPTTAETTITPSNGATYTANFDTKYVTFTVSTADSTMGTVSVTGTGVMDLGNDQYKVEKNTTVTITATAESNYEFVEWTATDATVDSTTTASTTTTPVEGATYTANFKSSGKTIYLDASKWDPGNADFAVWIHSTNSFAIMEKTSTGSYKVQIPIDCTGINFVRYAPGTTPSWSNYYNQSDSVDISGRTTYNYVSTGFSGDTPGKLLGKWS